MARYRRGFTLMELLVVVAIISILAGFVVSGAQIARKRGAMVKAKATIAALETAIAMYEVDMGDYPPSGNANMVTALTTGPGGEDSDWYGPYMKFEQESLGGGTLLDPWGNPYVYGKPGSHNPTSFDLYSTGPSGSGSGDDAGNLNNW